MQTNKKMNAFLLVGLNVLLGGCVTKPPIDTAEKNELLKAVMRDYTLLYECRDDGCNDYFESCDSCNQNLPSRFRVPAEGYSIKFTNLSKPMNRSIDEEIEFSLELEAKDEIIKCDKPCKWDIKTEGDAYVLSIADIGVCNKEKATSTSGETQCTYHSHTDGKTHHFLTLVFRNIDGTIKASQRFPFEPRMVFYSLDHSTQGLHEDSDEKKHRTTHGGGVDLD